MFRIWERRTCTSASPVPSHASTLQPSGSAAQCVSIACETEHPLVGLFRLILRSLRVLYRAHRSPGNQLPTNIRRPATGETSKVLPTILNPGRVPRITALIESPLLWNLRQNLS